MSTPSLRRLLIRNLIVSSALLVAATPLTGCSNGSSVTGEQLQPAPKTGLGVSATPQPTTPVVSPSESSNPELDSDKFYDLKVTVDNQTNSDLRLASATLGHADGKDGGHWDERATDVPARGSIQVSAYSSVQGQAIILVYTASASQPVKLTLIAQDPAIGSNNTNGTTVTGPMSVRPSITKGRDATATFKITSLATM